MAAKKKARQQKPARGPDGLRRGSREQVQAALRKLEKAGRPRQ